MADNHDVEIITIAVVFQSIMTGAFILRLISQHMRRAKIALDDILLTVAFVRHDRRCLNVSTGADIHQFAASLEIIVFAIGM